MTHHISLLVYLFACSLLVSAIDFDVHDEKIAERIRDGKTQLQMLEANPESPCWQDNIERLTEKKCDHMTYTFRQQIAFALTNCHLHLSQLDTFSCTNEEEKIHECVGNLAQDQRGFSTYNSFFTHLDNICLYARSKRFQESTTHAVNNLYQATVDSAELMRKWSDESQEISAQLKGHTAQLDATHEKLSDIQTLQKNAQDQIHTLTDVTKKSQTEILESQNEIKGAQAKMQQSADSILSTQTEAIEKTERIVSQVAVIRDEQQAVQDSVTQALENQKALESNQRALEQGQGKLLETARTFQKNIQQHFKDVTDNQENMLDKQQQTLKSQDEINEKHDALQISADKTRASLEELHEQQREVLDKTTAAIDDLAQKTREAHEDLFSSIDQVFLQHSVRRIVHCLIRSHKS